MTWWVQTLLGIGITLLATWMVLVITMLVAKPSKAQLGEAIRLLPDLLRFVNRLAHDVTLPRGVRVRLGLLLVYLAIPIDVIPDFIPVLGYADDVIVVIAVLRSIMRCVGVSAVRAHWPGGDDGFETMCRLAGLTKPDVCRPGW